MTWHRSAVSVNAAGLALPGGGLWYIEGFKANSTFGWQKATRYSLNGTVLIYYRSLYNSVWSDWFAR